MTKIALLTAAASFLYLSASAVTDRSESHFTQVINDVQVLSTTAGSPSPAAVDAIFKMPDTLRTGSSSRVEFLAADRTLTRVGANTLVSFASARRSLNLDHGSLLLNSPKGNAHSFIHTAAGIVAISAGTVIVTANAGGDCKVLTLEGRAEVRLPQNSPQRLNAGEMISLSSGNRPGQVLTFRLDEQIADSKLVTGFAQTLPSLPHITTQIARQTRQIKTGRAEEIACVAPVINPIQELNGSPFSFAGINPLDLPVPRRGIPPIGIVPLPPVPIVLNNLNFANQPNLVLSGHTIVLSNVILPNSGTAIFNLPGGTLAPNPNTGAAVIPGDVNFVTGVTYHGALANTPGIGFTIHTP